MRHDEIDRRILTIGGAHHGILHHQFTDPAGIPRQALQRRAARGFLERVDRGCYRIPGWPVTMRQKLVVATATGGVSAVASHRAAGRLWGLDGVRSAPVEILVERGKSSRRRRSVLVHETRHLSPADVTAVDGVPVTAPVRTIIDLATVLNRFRLEQAMEDGLRRKLYAIGDLALRFAELDTRGRSLGTLGRLLAERHGDAKALGSALEVLLRTLALEHGVDPPERQFEVRILQGIKVFLDFAWPHLLLGIECDGIYDHGTAIALRWDDDRQNDLVLQDWLILRFTWEAVRDRPHEVMTAILRAIERQTDLVRRGVISPAV